MDSNNTLTTKNEQQENGRPFTSLFDPPEDPASQETELWEEINKSVDLTLVGPILYSSQLCKKSKKMGRTLTRYYFLTNDYILHGSNKDYRKANKFVKHQGLKLVLTNDKGKKNKDTHYFNFFRGERRIILFTTDQELYWTWFSYLKRFCILSNFYHFYMVSRSLGKGSYGKVYLVENIREKAQYAVKVLEKSKIMAHARGLECLQNEISILRNIDSPYIIKIYEIFESASYIYIVMEYMEGGELYTRLQAKKSFTEFECLSIVRSVLEGLKYLEEKNIIHRDLKPENILLKTRDPESDIKIADFGLALDLNLAKNKGNLVRCGTPGYVAPEVMNPEHGQNVGCKSDVFSLGCVLYRLLTGKRLFNGGSPKAILKANKECVIDLSGLDGEKTVSNACRNFLMEILKKDVRERITASKALENDWFYSDIRDHTLDEKKIDEMTNQIPKARIAKYEFDVGSLKDINMGSGVSVRGYRHHQSYITTMGPDIMHGSRTFSNIYETMGSFYMNPHVPQEGNYADRTRSIQTKFTSMDDEEDDGNYNYSKSFTNRSRSPMKRKSTNLSINYNSNNPNKPSLPLTVRSATRRETEHVFNFIDYSRKETTNTNDTSQTKIKLSSKKTSNTLDLSIIRDVATEDKEK